MDSSEYVTPEAVVLLQHRMNRLRAALAGIVYESFQIGLSAMCSTHRRHKPPSQHTPLFRFWIIKRKPSSHQSIRSTDDRKQDRAPKVL